MATTLAEATKYTTNYVRRGVLETIIRDSIVMQKLPMIGIVGNAYQYLRENTLPTAEFYDVNEIWSESTGDVTQLTAQLKILGGDADVDNFLAATRSDKTDFTAETIDSKAKAVKHSFLDRFYYGDTATSSKQFDGLHKLCLGADMTGQNIHAGAGTTPGVLKASYMDQALDLILDGPPDAIITSRLGRRLITTYLRSKANIDYSTESYGKLVMGWGGIPIYIDDFLTATETIAGGAYTGKTTGASTSLFLVRFGTKDLTGFNNGDLQTIKMGQLESKDSKRWRIRWYVSMGLLRALSVAVIDGISTGAMTD
jgi:hypothetical protein